MHFSDSLFSGTGEGPFKARAYVTIACAVLAVALCITIVILGLLDCFGVINITRGSAWIAVLLLAILQCETTKITPFFKRANSVKRITALFCFTKSPHHGFFVKLVKILFQKDLNTYQKHSFLFHFQCDNLELRYKTCSHYFSV